MDHSFVMNLGIEEKEGLQHGETLINTGEIDPMGTVLRHPGVLLLHDTLRGDARLNTERLIAIHELLELCHMRWLDLLEGRSCFPLPMLTDLSKGYHEVGVYLCLVAEDIINRRKSKQRGHFRSVYLVSPNVPNHLYKFFFAESVMANGKQFYPAVCLFTMRTERNVVRVGKRSPGEEQTDSKEDSDIFQ
eukprot:TRINITY_DN5032_c0_g1_i1.p1 TRINITY_DN5032_c0_g1~~TRINITY_DN5032_c0_g1_i1.p1  ORF type:complete len:190 (+),score=40.92 TRINITY_DN5032_c0_g1_i1:278-847(+)